MTSVHFFTRDNLSLSVSDGRRKPRIHTELSVVCVCVHKDTTQASIHNALAPISDVIAQSQQTINQV
jgi:hypothetical protein